MSTKALSSFLCCIALSGCSGNIVGKWISQAGAADSNARRAAVRALDELGSTEGRVIELFARCAADESAQVRYAALKALENRGEAARSAVGVVKTALNDPEKRVRLKAALALHKIDPADKSFEPVLTSAMREGDGQTLLDVGAMGASGAWAVPTLAQLLSHQSTQVRVLAAKDLGQIGPAAKSATGALESALRDSNPAVKAAAKHSLDRIESGSAIPSK